MNASSKTTWNGSNLILIDFDGTINDYKGGWISPGEIHQMDAPLPYAIKVIVDLMQIGFDIGIHSVRCNTEDGKAAIWKYLKDAGVPEHLLDKVQYFAKPAAVMYIDDRAIQFNGNWVETAQEIANFEPWYYKERGRGKNP